MKNEKREGDQLSFWRMSVSYPPKSKNNLLKSLEQFMKFCSFFQIVFSFFFYTVKADWGGPCPSPFLKEVICVIEVKTL